MKNCFKIAILFILTMSISVAGAFSPVKVGVYNIHGGVGTDSRNDLPRIARVLKSGAPDVIGLNEVNRYWVGSNQDEVLATQMGPGWTAHFGKTINKWWAAADYGNAIITRLPVVSTQSWLLSEYPDQERRGLMRVTVRKDGVPIHIFNTHMGLNAPMRQLHAREILQIMSGFSGYKVLMGDFNEQRTGTSVEIFASALTDAFGEYGIGPGNTYSATNPTRRIDLIWLGDGLAATSCYVPMFPDARVASDHLPVFAEIVDPDAVQPVINELSVRVNSQERLSAADSVDPDPDAYTQGSVVLSTSGGASANQIVADNLEVDTLVTLHEENFNNAPVAGAPADWKLLYLTEGKQYQAGVSALNGHKFWRQRSEGYVKFHYAPEPYPIWKNYEVSAQIKTIDLGGGVWRLLAYNYPADDTAYETYKIEVRHDSGGLPQLHLMKGEQYLATSTLFNHDVDPYDWNVYALEVTEAEITPVQTTRRLTAYVNGRRVASATDTIAGPADPNEYSQGSVALTTVGGSLGWCQVYMDDLQVRQWQTVTQEDFDGAVSPDWQHLYTTPGSDALAGVASGRNGNGWSQMSDAYTRYHFAPNLYPQWQNLSLRADVRTVHFGGGKWRMKAYNYPASDLGYETYKLEVHASAGNPLLRIMKGGAMLTEARLQSLGIDPAQWHRYELNIRTFQPEPRILTHPPVSDITNWTAY